MIPADLEIETPSDEPIVRYRRFVRAAPERIFAAWTTPAALKQWWGPADWTLAVCEIDLRVGGGYRMVFETPAGERHGYSGTYLEIETGRRLVNTFVLDATPDRHSVDTVEFLPVEGGSVVSGLTRFASVVHRDEHVNGGMEHGMRDTYRRLDAWLRAVPKEV